MTKSGPRSSEDLPTFCETSLEEFLCLHPETLCNKGFKEILWPGGSLGAGFVAVLKQDCRGFGGG